MKTTTILPFNALEAIYKISSELSDSQLNPEITSKVTKESLQIAEFLDITEQQAWFFSIIYVQQSMGFSCDLGDIMNDLTMRPAKFVKYRQDIITLIEKRIIKSELEKRDNKKSARANLKYMRIYENILQALYHNIPVSEANKNEQLDIYEFCNVVSDLIEERNNDIIDTDYLWGEVSVLEMYNPQLEIIEKLSEMKISLHDRTLLYEMCDDLVRGGGDTGLEKTINHIYDSQRQRFRKIREIIENKSILIELELITVQNTDFVNDINIALTPSALELILKQDAEMFLKQKTLKDVISVNDIQSKDLYFEEKFQEQINFFQSSLCQEKFTAMQKRLQEMKLPKGVAAVFYGEPGTGKTESVYQIAKATGRDVFYVDISQTKSMWFGESEKRIKAIFNEYARLCKKSTIKPILLFNEADAVLGKRKDNNASNVAQTENAIQNIILEQMEKSDGILIATTNLVGNLDTAFERRFLFKLKFEMPTFEAKKQIWKSKLNWLNDEQVATLANRFQFSGGEIDNIARKAIINEVISGVQPTLENLIEYCEAEHLITKRLYKLGYK